eukprot:13629247-Alexandrium_andersonii.AAC.1
MDDQAAGQIQSHSGSSSMRRGVPQARGVEPVDQHTRPLYGTTPGNKDPETMMDEPHANSGHIELARKSSRGTCTGGHRFRTDHLACRTHGQ